ncbi:DegT/DnrJ/EryC1/StrS family aminotransferase [Candidatus Woesearchaeota archaeon]|nr:DegT/DnrJ/EryC1/StrS family aminotransferase [Candidatus Woesearchaeota archaeon]
MSKEKAISKLKKLTGKKHIFFTDRGNTAISIGLELAKYIGKKKVLIPDQGGWLTYRKYPKKLKLELEYFQTEHGLINRQGMNFDNDSILLMNSMPGYYIVQEDTAQIYNLCRKKGSFMINDASGSIGTDVAKYGDLVIGSFGRWKPIDVGEGGFIAFDNPEYEIFFKKNCDKLLHHRFDELNEKLGQLPERLKMLDKIVKKIKRQLRYFDVINRENHALNVIVRFQSPEEKMKIVDFCNVYGYEFTLCPRYIRVWDSAISIEVKRIG